MRLNKTKRKSKRKKNLTRKKTSNKINKIFVLSFYKERRVKYKENKLYEIYEATPKSKISKSLVKECLCYHNVNLNTKLKNIAITEDHYDIWEKIIKDDLKNVVILEDDVYIKDFKKLNKIIGDKFMYIGGELYPKVQKDIQKFKDSKLNKLKLKNGVNLMSDNDLSMMGAFGYYIPNAQVAQQLIDVIPVANKKKTIDTELKRVRWKYPELINGFYYPALAVINYEDAITGHNYKALVNKEVDAIYKKTGFEFYGRKSK